MLFSSNHLAIVGASHQPSLSSRRICLFNTTTGATLRELNFLTSILIVRMNRQRLIVILQDKAYIYEINSLIILDIIETVPNIKGLCAFFPYLDACYLALPASTTKGSALLYNIMECHLHCEWLPDILAASSSSGHIHLFTLGFASHPRSKRSSGFLGSIIPDDVYDMLDLAYHHVLHNLVPTGVKR
ncbi:autophagy-related protein 18b [Glycine max]|uniref:autophagy-related protein 18b n=1 Tax=Glycine max TaxID=3847 RepID=UPI0007191B46|nr:autophagy-related protein 18b [Glycine max]|eukprot:XP_006599925.2 autophagy-related protein 18b [Glycine max]